MRIRSHKCVLFVLVTLSALSFGLTGCSNNSLSPFQPEIGNASDNFQFQATAIENTSTMVTYSWNNSSTMAKVNQSSAITRGNAVVVLSDANRTEVYRRTLGVNGDSTSSAGVAGVWTVTVTLTNLSGTLNFRAEKK